MFLVSVFNVSSEVFLFMGIEQGVTGSVVSIVGSNSILVTCLNWLLDGMVLSPLQVLGIATCFAGVLLISLGDQIAKRARLLLSAL